MLRVGVPGGGAVGVVVELQAGWSPETLAQAVFPIAVTPAGTGVETTTPKSAEAEPPAGTVPAARVQTEPGLAPAQLHPAELAPAANVVLAGTVSESVVPIASWFPELERASE